MAHQRCACTLAAVAALLSVRAAGAATGSPPLPSPPAVRAVMDAVTGAFMAANPPGDCHWQRATFFMGAGETLSLTNGTALLDYSSAWAEANYWCCGGALDPNDMGAGWGFSTLWPFAPADYKLALGVTMNRALGTQPSPLPPYSWWWVDTLAMNVPQWLAYGDAMEEEDAFTTFARAQYNWTKFGGPAGGAGSQPGLFSPAHGLWWRDHTFVNATSPNGAPVFWGRGSAWAGIMLAKALALGVLPPGDAWRADMEATLAAMAAALAPLQGADGLWRASLLDAAAFPNPETTSSAGITAMLAYGVRAGLLDAATYTPVVAAAWEGLTSVSLANGTGVPGWCQPVGDRPAAAAAGDTSDFCAGFVLLAAAEVFRLVAAPAVDA
jgi:unsaturated rhamnogalacturonyl hydrolase